MSLPNALSSTENSPAFVVVQRERQLPSAHIASQCLLTFNPKLVFRIEL